MSDLRLISRDLTDFISLYRENPCLWKVKSKEYSDKQKKNAAYDILIASKEGVIKRINSLRTCFRKELKKYKASLHSSMDEEEVYKPNLWYFNLLTFLLDQETPGQDGMDNLTDSIADVSINKQKTIIFIHLFYFIFKTKYIKMTNILVSSESCCSAIVLVLHH